MDKIIKGGRIVGFVEEEQIMPEAPKPRKPRKPKTTTEEPVNEE